MIAEFCSWCNEYIRRKNVKCRECETCLKCPEFERNCCVNGIVVAEYRRELKRPDFVLGIGPPLCKSTVLTYLLMRGKRHFCATLILHLLNKSKEKG